MYADMYLLNGILNHLLRLGSGPPFEQDKISRIIPVGNTFFLESFIRGITAYIHLFFAFFHAFLTLFGPSYSLFGPFSTLFNAKNIIIFSPFRQKIPGKA